MKKYDIKFDFDDILLMPDTYTSIKKRSHINILTEQASLPLMTAPMDTVVDLNNIEHFLSLGILPILPRTVSVDEFMKSSYNNHYYDIFVSIGLENVKDIIDMEDAPNNLCIDIANGHMEVLFEVTKDIKKKHPFTSIMVGNIANPATYEYYAKFSDIDCIRVGIGNGNACLTTKQTSIGYPKGSLLSEIAQIKKEPTGIKKFPKIVADGGMKGYSDIIKALALGADYVMIGSLFNKALESAAPTRIKDTIIPVPRFLRSYLWNKGVKMEKDFYGMSTKRAQMKLGKKILKTSEGVERVREVEYTLSGWTQNFKDYLRSTMSYCDAKNLKAFIGEAQYNFITENAFNRFNK